MTTTTQQKPTPDTRYVKQGAPQGDFAEGERTTPPTSEGPDFARGERTTPPVPEVDDFASGEHTLPASNTAGDFASGEHTLPVPENPALADTLPPVPAAPSKKT